VTNIESRAGMQCMLQVGEAVQLYIQRCRTVAETAAHFLVQTRVSSDWVCPRVLVDESVGRICT